MKATRGQPDADLFASAFAALPGSVALIDSTGTIIAGNERWKRFASENRGPADAFEGWNYLTVCRNARTDAGPSLARSLEALLAGDREEVLFEYPCQGVDRERWFLLQATRFRHAGDAFALINHHDITRRRLAEMEAREQAERDPLTGLYRRHAFTERLREMMGRARRRDEHLFVLFIDLDGFKTINDTHGHRAGDAVLAAIGERLRGQFRDEDALARYGGDELVMMTTPTDEETNATRVAERLHAAIEAPVDFGAGTRGIRASIGVSVFPEDGRDADSLLLAADEAMYRAKHAGGGRTALAAGAAAVTDPPPPSG
jgi:diguanylate cyclase (GGDEF)-like protein